MIGTTVGSYRITAKVSIGGMGTVYKAEHTLLGKLAAVKVLHPELRNNRDVVDRFFNEAKATTQIKHPGIVEIFDFDYLPSGDGYIIMEFLEGMSLAKRIKTGGKMNEGEAAILLRGVCSALSAAHAKRIVHRDLKPDNIFLTPDPDAANGERPKLLDFGIAKLTDTGLSGSGSATKTGAVMGTPTYMSPEQCKGTGEVDHRADLYSIGCIFYELVAGRPPFTNLGAGELIGAHLYIEPVRPSITEPSISSEAEQLIMALLSKDPAKRPQTARDLGQRFSRIAHQQGWITGTGPSGLTRESLAIDAPTTTTPMPARVDGTAPPFGGAAGRAQVPSVEEAIAATLPSNSELLARGPVTGESLDPPPQPTTLSGAASGMQSVVNPPRSRKLWLAGIATLAAGAVAFAIVMATGGHADPVKPAAPKVITKLPPPPPAVATPTPVETPVPAATPPPVETPVIPPPVAAPVASPPPVVASPPPKKLIRHTKEAVVTPIKKPDKPADKAAADKGKGAGSGSGHILIETDL